MPMASDPRHERHTCNCCLGPQAMCSMSTPMGGKQEPLACISVTEADWLFARLSSTTLRPILHVTVVCPKQAPCLEAYTGNMRWFRRADCARPDQQKALVFVLMCIGRCAGCGPPWQLCFFFMYLHLSSFQWTVFTFCDGYVVLLVERCNAACYAVASRYCSDLRCVHHISQALWLSLALILLATQCHGQCVHVAVCVFAVDHKEMCLHGGASVSQAHHKH